MFFIPGLRDRPLVRMGREDLRVLLQEDDLRVRVRFLSLLRRFHLPPTVCVVDSTVWKSRHRVLSTDTTKNTLGKTFTTVESSTLNLSSLFASSSVTQGSFLLPPTFQSFNVLLKLLNFFGGVNRKREHVFV